MDEWHKEIKMKVASFMYSSTDILVVNANGGWFEFDGPSYLISTTQMNTDKQEEFSIKLKALFDEYNKKDLTNIFKKL